MAQRSEVSAGSRAFVRSEEGGCPIPGVDAETAMAYNYANAYDGVAVVDATFVTACLGKTSHWIVGRELNGGKTYFLGDTSLANCSLWSAAPSAPYAVVRYAQTAGLFRGPENACVTPGEKDVTSDSVVGGLVAFEKLEDAKRFARSYGWEGR